MVDACTDIFGGALPNNLPFMQVHFVSVNIAENLTNGDIVLHAFLKYRGY